jgi:endonuclease I
MNRIFTLLFINLFWISSFSQIPAGYYDNAEGLSGEDLRTALSNIIDDHTVKSYDYLWTAFQTTDVIGSNQVYDMYSIRADGSSDYEFHYTADQCGNYSVEGDCYNREHSFPKSWFDDNSPMYTDLFHLYPTDGKVNGQRGNLPYGEVGNANWTSTNGSKRGTSNYPGYTGTVFEPIDEYKGDFARSYFYMLTRYKSLISGWNSDMLSGDNFSVWAKNMLLDWDEQDPVSQKEIDRNNDIYDIQHNRNPFIDHPEWGVAVWDPSSNIKENSKSNVRIWYAKDALNWKFNKQTSGTLEIYNIVGEKINQISIDSKASTYSLELKKGIYIADFKLDYRKVVKFVVE